MQKNILIIVGIVIVVAAGFLFYSGTSDRVSPVPSADGPKKIALLGYLRILESSNQGFKKGLADLGYVEGKDVVYEEFWADGDWNKMSQMADQIIADKDVDLAVGNPGEGAMALKAAAERAGSDLPILFVSSFNPLAMKLIESFQSPGGNVTGVAVDLPLLTGKRLEFLRRLAPNAKKLGVIIGTFSDITADTGVAEIRKQAANFGFTLVEYTVDAPPGPQGDAAVKKVTESIKAGEFDAFYRMLGPVTSSPGALEAYGALVKRMKVPSIFWGGEPGSTLNFDSDYFAVGEQAAPLADKIFKGAKPSQIPAEYAKENILTINKTGARELGITIPDSLLSIANRIIE